MGRKIREGYKKPSQKNVVKTRNFGAKIFGKIHQSWLVVAMCAGVIIGTILALIFRIKFFSSPIWVGVSVAVLVILYLVPRRYLVVLALGAGMVLAFYKSSAELAGEDYIRQFYDKTVVVAGTIDGDPETDEKGTKLKLRDLKFGGGEKQDSVKATKGNLYISMSKNEDLARGDEIVLKGELAEGFGTYAGFMYKPKIMNWTRPSPGDLVLTIRNWFAERVQKLVPEPEQKLGLSYLLGMKSGLPDDLDENLRTAGLVHIVVASGAHLSILVDVARKIFGRLSRMTGVTTSLIFVVFFMAMVGWTPSIMRAGMMSILKILAWRVGRKFAAWRIILLVAAGTLLINPMFITNLGWLLSFASFAGIMVLGPSITQFFYGEKKPKFVANMVLTTLAATLMTLPITLYYYGSVSLISVVANLLILPTLPYAMGLVFLTGVVAGLPGVETAVSFITTKMLDFHIGVVGFFGQMKSFLVEIETGQAWVFRLYAVILVPVIGGIIWRKVKRYKNVKIGERMQNELRQDLTVTE